MTCKGIFTPIVHLLCYISFPVVWFVSTQRNIQMNNKWASIPADPSHHRNKLTQNPEILRPNWRLSPHHLHFFITAALLVRMVSRPHAATQSSPFTLNLKQASCWSPSCPSWYLPCVWLNPFPGLLFKWESVGGPLAFPNVSADQWSISWSVPSACNVVFICYRASKGEIVIPAGWFPEAEDGGGGGSDHCCLACWWTP